ncbi:MAG: ATP-binding protein [Verrucomicrobiia bacterium]|jgi:signal transduction histidine kinase
MADLEQTVTLGRFFAQEFQDLQKTAELRSYDAGQVIFSQGARGDGFFCVESGEVEISAEVSDGERKVFAKVGQGEIFGEMAVLDDGPRSASAIAGPATKAYFIGRDELFTILQNNPEALIRLVRFFSQRIRDTNSQYIEEIVQAEKLAVVGRFARTIVHDFKNPLNIIGLSSEMASAAWSTQETRSTSAERIGRQICRMSNMLNELLEFSRGKSQQLVLAGQDYAEFLTELISEIQIDVAEKNIELCLPDTPPAVKVQMDPQRLSQLFYNLINNAADEMSGGGKITFSFRVDDVEILTRVNDSGPGISPEIIDKLFEPFATHGKSHGTGLGLSICQKILEDHGGRIWADSNPGDGATFCFTLPLSK